MVNMLLLKARCVSFTLEWVPCQNEPIGIVCVRMCAAGDRVRWATMRESGNNERSVFDKKGEFHEQNKCERINVM